MSLCLQPATCDDILPISAPGLKFQCPEETTQYDPSLNKRTPPTEKHCCMVGWLAVETIGCIGASIT
jgi:hypothetical protein